MIKNNTRKYLKWVIDLYKNDQTFTHKRLLEDCLIEEAKSALVDDDFKNRLIERSIKELASGAISAIDDGIDVHFTFSEFDTAFFGRIEKQTKNQNDVVNSMRNLGIPEDEIHNILAPVIRHENGARDAVRKFGFKYGIPNEDIADMLYKLGLE